MFDNIGKKIKSLAEILCWIGIIFTVIISISYFQSNILVGKSNILIGVAIIVVGFLASWVGTFLLYGFGELIDKTSETAQYTAFIAMRMGICSEDGEEDTEKTEKTEKAEKAEKAEDELIEGN